MGRASGEALLLSALLKNQDVTAAAQYGVGDQHFRGFSNEYQWMQSYLSTYGTQPSLDAFFAQFPDFPFRDHDDVRFACDLVIKDHARANFSEMVIRASELNEQGDVRGAFEALQTHHYVSTSAKPRNLITDFNVFEALSGPPKGLQVPWPTLQEATAGIGPGQLWYIAARLNQGKSALLAALAVEAILAGKRVLYYSLEMTEAEIRTRIHVMLARRMGEDWLKAYDIKHAKLDIRAYEKFVKSLPDRITGELNIHTPADGIVMPSTVASRASEYDLVEVDYTTLMYTDKGEPASTDWRNALQISNRLKQVCLATDTPIVGACQINREGDRGEEPPKVGQLAQSDSFGQDADVVITTRLRNTRNVSICSLEKNRHGPAGMKWWMKFSVNDGVFDEITEDMADDLVMAAEEQAMAPKGGLKLVRD